MIEFFKKIIKCRLQVRHKISVYSGQCVRCQYNRNDAYDVAQVP